MSKNCINIFYDKNGNRSETYYSVLEKKGEKAALNAYLTEMLSDTAVLKYELGNVDTAEILSKLKTDSKLKMDSDTHVSFSGFFKNKLPFDKQLAIAYTAINLKTTDVMQDIGKYPQYKGKSWIEVNNDIKNNYFKFNKDTKEAETSDGKILEEFHKYKIDAEKLNTLQTESGTGVHKLIEILLDLKKENKFDMSEFNRYYNIALAEFESTEEYQSLGYAKKKIAENLRSTVAMIVREIDTLERDTSGEFEIFTEFSLKTNKLKLDGTPFQGKIDLLIYDKKNNVGYIYDFKTKSEKSYLNMDYPYADVLPAPFDTFRDNPKTKTQLQLSLYKRGVEVKYKFPIKTIKSVIITSSITHDGSNVGERTWGLQSVVPSMTKIVNNRPLSVGEVDDTDNLVIKKSKISDVVSEIFDEKLIVVSKSMDSFIQKQQLSITEKNGKFIWWDKINQKYITAFKKEDLIAKMKASYKDYLNIKKRATIDLVEFFNTGIIPKKSIWNIGHYKEKALTILQPYHTDGYELLTVNDVAELKSIGNDVIIAKNKVNGQIDVISIAAALDSTHIFHENGEDARTNLFGKYISDKVVSSKYGVDGIPKATTHDFNLFRLNLVAAFLKASNPEMFSNFNKLMSVTLLGSEYNYKYSTVESQTGLAKIFKDILDTNNEDVPSEIVETISIFGNTNTKDTAESILRNFFEEVSQATDPLIKLASKHRGINTREVSSVVGELRKISKDIDKLKWDTGYHRELKKLLDKYYTLTYDAVLAVTNATSKEAVYSNSLFMSVNKVFLAFNDLLVLENPKFKKVVLKSINSLTTMADPLADKLHLAIESYMQQARAELVDPIQEHLELQKKLLEETPGVSILDSFFSPDISKKVFEPMLEDGFRFEDGNVENWLKFKDPEKRPNDSSYLTKTQREYIRFFVKHSKSSLSRLFPSNYNQKLLSGSVKTKWNDLYIPVIPEKATEALRQTMSLKNSSEITAKDVLTSFTKAVKSLRKKPLTGTEKASKPYSFTSFFINQVDSIPGRGSRETRNLLRITEDGKKIDNDRNIELNPAVILNTALIEASRKEHMQAATLATMAVDADLVAKGLSGGIDTGYIREIFSSITNMRIHNRVEEEEGALAAIADVSKKASSFALFFGSIRQITTESSTAFFQSLSQSLANNINSIFFKGDNLYSTKDRIWAVKELMSDFGRDAMEGLGMYNSSIGQFTDTEYNAFKSKFLFQTKHGYWVIHQVLRQNFESVVLAQMHKKGITKKAYAYDKVKKKYTYDETLDNRFYVYDENQEIDGQKPVPPKPDSDDYNKWLFWKAHREKMIKENGIDLKTNKMIKPFTNEEMQSMKYHSIQLFGPMDASETQAAEATALGRAGLAFKRWIKQRAATYYTEKSKSYRVGEWVPVYENGNIVDYDYRWQDFEGYINSMWALLKDIKSTKSLSQSIDNLTGLQKRNISKLLSDLILYTIITALLAVLKRHINEIADSKKTKDISVLKELVGNNFLVEEMTKGVLNGVGDIMPLIAFDSVISGSAFAAASVAQNSAKQAAATMWYLTTGDFDRSITAADKTMNLFGVYRSVKGISSIFTNNENKK